MAVAPEYRWLREGNWRFVVLTEKWNREMRDRILSLVERQAFATHPQTLELRPVEGEGRPGLFLKVFHPAGGFGTVKDCFRQSKAFRSLRQGVGLADSGFIVPTAIAAGERRRGLVLQRAFLLTSAVHGRTLPDFLRDSQSVKDGGLSLSGKRKALRHLAEQISRLHALGFVHGDLVPTNILVSEGDWGQLGFIMMDNDRTRRYPQWLPQSLWKRNLVQLNRFPLPSISLQDRMRFFRAYVGEQNPQWKTRRLVTWLEKKTRQRRQALEAVDPQVSFRQLMRWEENAGAKNRN